ncbi:MAG TPA: hypothetical protein VGD48_31070 [Kutzneria sp.]
MTFSQAELVAQAGVDPWALRDKLKAGDPAQIETLAAVFYSAGGDMADSNAAKQQARTYVGEGYTVNGSSPVDFDAEVKGTRQTPEHLNAIAKVLTGVAGDLDRQTGGAVKEVGSLESTLAGIDGEYTTFMQGIGHHLPPDDRQAARQEFLDKAVAAVKSSGTQVTKLVTDYEIALMGYLKSMGDLGYVPSANLQEGPNVLDLKLDNADGELNGGINPNLPTDLATLQKLLDAARADGVDPKRYAALLQQYWLVKAANEAGIDLSKWDPKAGVDGNLGNIMSVYKFYGKLFLDHPELQWAGMANMIGPSFAGGFMDLDSMKDFAHGLADKINSLPPELRAAVPQELRDLASAGADLTGDELGWFENKFLAMQKHIFIDQGSMHEAYVNGGAGAIDEMRRAGLIDDRAANAWNDMASGDPSRIQHGNTDLLYREQNQVIAKQYDEMYNHDGVVGKAMTYGMTVAGQASIPGTHTPGEYKPLTVGADVTVPGLFSDETVGAHVKTPLPSFNVADRDHRWDYVTHDTLPAYQKLLAEHPDQARAIVASSVPDRVADQRLSHRWPQLAEHLLNDWDVDVDADIRFHWPWS